MKIGLGEKPSPVSEPSHSDITEQGTYVYLLVCLSDF